MSFLRRKSHEELANVDLRLSVGTAFEKKSPATWEFLTRTRWEDGTERETGTVMLFLDEGLLKACLRDRDAKLVAFCASDSVEGLFQAIEKGLVKDDHDWRKERPFKPQGRRRG